ncbi:subunit 17 of mediator complex-domain-containing protein [Cyathus striatus]|nr:subunit 17 of mediator complex-domain-containing protein [Cyathus striatus]
MEDPAWKKLKLSLERPYKDDDGNPFLFWRISHLLGMKESSSARLRKDLKRIFNERGADFFERKSTLHGQESQSQGDNDSKAPGAETEENVDETDENDIKPMSMEELHRMRTEIFPHLSVAYGEMTHARELLSSLLSSGPASATDSGTAAVTQISATMVTKPSPIASVQAFNRQLTIGSKDEALRKASVLFKRAAEGMERGQIRGEKYWVDALKIRRANWGLIPAPLPAGSATGKGADKSSKDFLVSFALEESPALFRRKAIAQMAGYKTTSSDLTFPYRDRSRLRVHIISSDSTDKQARSTNIEVKSNQTTLGATIRAAQEEIVDQEIFALIVKEAGSFSGVPARVSERLVVIEAAPGVEIKFELVKQSAQLCNLVYQSLHVLLSRRHNHNKQERLGSDAQPPILKPIINIIQYQVFCKRIESEIANAARALARAGVPSSFSFTPIGETGLEIIKIVSEYGNEAVGGEAVLRIDHRHTVRFTFMSPSTLTAHLSQATLNVSTISQLSQLLMDEIEKCLLQRICELGRQLSDCVDGTWFIDLNRCVGRWEGCVV